MTVLFNVPNQGPDGSFGALVDVSEKSENINMNSLRYIIKCFPMCTWVMLTSTKNKCMYIIVHNIHTFGFTAVKPHA